MALVDEMATVLSNQNVGPRLYIMMLRCPQIAEQVMPGQFVHVQLTGFENHILRRPISVFDVNREEGTITLVYQVVGVGTEWMTTVAEGAHLDLIGAIGQGWTVPEAGQRVLIVGGGVGSAPLFILSKMARQAGAQVDIVLAAATKDALVTLPYYTEAHGGEPVCATDDGTYGFAGFATEPAKKLLAETTYDRVYVCGPEPLMHIIANLAAEAHVPCELSMEKRMACGVGACLSCIVETVDGRKRSCVDGPVFPAEKVVW